MTETGVTSPLARDWRWGELPRPLAGLGGKKPEAPDWFNEALRKPLTTLRACAEGAEIEVEAWGDPGKPGVLLIHGSMAHARWWHPVAQLLSVNYRVASLSFAGMGHSDWRDQYSIDLMAREAMAAAEVAGLFEAPTAPTFVAHSFGGKAAAVLAQNVGNRLLGTVFLDSFILPVDELGSGPPYKARAYETKAQAIERFRLSPDQPCENLYILDEIARGGITQRNGQWTWCFDPDFFRKLTYRSGWREACNARCRLAFVRGTLSNIVTNADAEVQRQAMPSDTLFVEVPEAHHHVMIDQPLVLTSTIQTIIEAWRLA